MEIFEWVEEIESIYDNLVDKAKKESLEEIQKERSEQEKLLEETTRRNEDIIKDALKAVSKIVREESTKFEQFLTNLSNNIEKYYNDNRNDLINSMFKELGFDF